MAVKLTLTRNVFVTDDNRINSEIVYLNDQAIITDTTIVDGATDQLLTISLDADEIVALYIMSDQDLKLETNDSVSPTDTINLKANQPWIWESGSYYSNLLTGDVTKMYLTNASGADAILKMIIMQDATP